MEITKIEPMNWFVGMQEPILQLTVYGTGLEDIRVSSNIPSMEIIDDIQSDNNIALIRLDLTHVTNAGEYDLFFEKGEQKVNIKYSLYNKKPYRRRNISAADTIYLLMPDRFDVSSPEEGITDVDATNPNGWHGGNLKGINKHLDYIKTLGVTSLWLTPVFKNEGKNEKNANDAFCPYHGYAITDFYGVDRHFGTFEDYVNVVKKAHQKELKMIKDIVFNHCSINHLWNKNTILKEWFNCSHAQQITNYDVSSIYGSYVIEHYKQQTVEGWFTPNMIDLNLKNRDLLTYLTQMTIWWIEMTDIDAIRMDTYLYSDASAMLSWQSRINAEYPGFPIIAETWINESAYTAKIQNESAKVVSDYPLIVMDFAFQKQLSNAFTAVANGNKDAAKILYNHFLYDFQYYSAQHTLAFLDNHDMNRWLFDHPNIDMMKLAMGILLTVPRVPQIFYGTEILLNGSGWNIGDGYMREDYPWNWDEKYQNPIVRKQRKEMLGYTTKLLNFRKQSRALTQGIMVHFMPTKNVYVYVRKYENEVILVIANMSQEKEILACKDYIDVLDGYTSFINVIDNKKYSLLSNKKLSLNKSQILILKNY